MIRAVSLFDQIDREIFTTNFARVNINLSLLNSSILRSKESFPHTIEHIEVGMYSLSLLLEPNYTLSVLADRTNTEKELKKYLSTLSEEIIQITNNGVNEESINKVHGEIEELAEEKLSLVPVKATFAGSGGVGKTTMVKLLAQDKRVLEYNPTLLADVEQLRTQIGAFQVSLFTVAGQPRYRKTWDVVSEATDIVVLVLKSDQANLNSTKEVVLPKVRELMPYSRLIAIANKQDLPGVLSPGVIQEQLGVPTYGMVAIRDGAKDRLISILEHMISRVP